MAAILSRPKFVMVIKIAVCYLTVMWISKQKIYDYNKNVAMCVNDSR